MEEFKTYIIILMIVGAGYGVVNVIKNGRTRENVGGLIGAVIGAMFVGCIPALIIFFMV